MLRCGPYAERVCVLAIGCHHYSLLILHDIQHSTAQHSTAQHSTAQHSTAQHSTAQHSTAQHSTAQHSTAQHSTAQHSTCHGRACIALLCCIYCFCDGLVEAKPCASGHMSARNCSIMYIHHFKEQCLCSAQAQEEPDDVMLSDIEDDTAQPNQPPAHQVLQAKGRANRPLPSPQAQAANHQRPAGRPAALAEEDEPQSFRFPAMYEGKGGGTPAIDLPGGTWGIHQPGKQFSIHPSVLQEQHPINFTIQGSAAA